MAKAKFVIRKAGKQDTKAIWLIRNSLIVRKSSYNRQVIDLVSHQAWFLNKYFKNLRNYCFVSEEKKAVIGYCRFDLVNNKYLVSIALKPRYQGAGLGNILLNRSLKLLKTDKEIIAEIKYENSASIKIFHKNNFIIYGQNSGVIFFKYVKRLNNQEKRLIDLYYLILKQTPKKSSAVVWLQGDRYDRAKKILELYKAWAPKIVIAGNNALIGKNKRQEENNILLEAMVGWLVRRRVKRSDIIIDKNSLNTKQQAENIINLAKSKNWKSLIITGSTYYQPRVFLTFLRQAEIKKWQGKIINQPAFIAWHKIPGGRKKFTWQYFNEEKEKIKKYKKDLSALGQGINYLLN